MRIQWHTKRQRFCREDLAQPEPCAIRHFVKFNRNGKVSTWGTKIPQAGMDGQAAATLPKSSKCLQQVPGCKIDFPPHCRKSDCTALAEGWAACHPPHLRDGEISQDVCKSQFGHEPQDLSFSNPFSRNSTKYVPVSPQGCRKKVIDFTQKIVREFCTIGNCPMAHLLALLEFW